MRSLLVILSVLFSVPALAQAPKQVEVINDPLMVEVINPAAPAAAAHWQLLGFTAETYPGDMGGHFGVTRKCQLEFPDSRMCSWEEVFTTTRIPEGLTGIARVHSNLNAKFGVLIAADPSSIGNSCIGFTSSLSPQSSTLVNAVGGQAFVDVGCEIARSIACCALVP